MRNAKIRLTKCIAGKLPAPVVYASLIRLSGIARQRIFQQGFRAADPSKTALDIGANRGIITYHLSRRFARVHAFEPNAELGDFLEKVLPPNCTLHRCGLSERAGESELSLALEAGIPIHGRGRILEVRDPSQSYAVQKVRLETLDSFVLRDVGLVKIDVEGHEEKVIRGGMETLGENRPVLIVEIERRHTGKPAGETVGYIESLGYEGFFFENGRRRPVREYEECMQDPDYPVYINDFLFLPR